MKSSTVELKLQLGESLASEVASRAAVAKMTPEIWVATFLAKGRLTPEQQEELLEELV